MPEVNKGKTHSEKTKRKISKANKGKKRSKSIREEMSISRVGRKSVSTLPVIIDNEYFDTTKEASKYVGVHPKTISDRLKRQVSGYKYA